MSRQLSKNVRAEVRQRFDGHLVAGVSFHVVLVVLWEAVRSTEMSDRRWPRCRGQLWTMVRLNVLDSPPLWSSVCLCLWGLLLWTSAPPCKLSVSTDSRPPAHSVVHAPYESPKWPVLKRRPLLRPLVSDLWQGQVFPAAGDCAAGD